MVVSPALSTELFIMEIMPIIRWYKKSYIDKKSSTSRRFTLKSWRKRNIKWWMFNLTLEDYIDILQSDCHYCWSEAKERKISNNKKYYTRIKTQWIDRVDSSIWYTFYNVVPCCKRCNALKAYMSYDEFQKRKQEIFYYAEWKTYNECYALWLKFWSQIHPNIKNRKIVW